MDPTRTLPPHLIEQARQYADGSLTPAEPRNTAVLRLMTLAFWQAGDLPAAGRAVRDWIREEPGRPAPYRTAARIYEDMGSLSTRVRFRSSTDKDAGSDVVPLTRIPCEPSRIWNSTMAA